MTDAAPETTPEEPEKEVDPKTLRPLRRSDFKQVALLKKGIRKFLRSHRDLITDEDSREIGECHENLDAILTTESSTRADLEKAAEKLTKKCEASVPGYKYSALRENVEVFFVAIVLAMAIRAYIGQPSRIPTGSMQPTLNGIIAYPTPETASPGQDFVAPADYERPGKLKRLFDKVWYGRSHIEMISDRDDLVNIADGQNFYEEAAFKLFPRTTMKTVRGQVFTVPGTRSRVEQLLNENLFGKYQAALKKGDVIARGYIDTGDWVVVDRLTYHWRMPRRDDIFVFTTRDIPGTSRGENGGPQHYIKRLVGEPGDTLKIEPPILLVNGEPGQEFGIRRVMKSENGYPGYQRYLPEKWSTIPPKHYIALGDNSRGSADSRDWGFVPAENIVGRAVGVYFPFGHHFGPVR